MIRIPLLIAVTLLTACGGAKMRAPALAPLALTQAPKLLTKNHFQRDKIGTISESAMREILNAPVYLEHGARVGIVPVETGYELDGDVPIEQVTGTLAQRLSDGGYFEVVSEVTTDWPGTRSVAGLREIATRYRAEYLLLYRHRFVDWDRANGWAWSYLAVVPMFFMPGNTLEHAGVLEATLFDVRTGTLLFTVFERVEGEHDVNIWHNDTKRRHYKARLLAKAADTLSAQVEDKLRALIAARPEVKEGEAVASLPALPEPADARLRAPRP